MPASYFKHAASISKAIAMVAPPRTFKTRVYLYYGPTGVGKSRAAMDALPGAHWKQPSTDWWDTYDGKQSVVFDDYGRWTLPYGWLLRLLDRYPLLVQEKGGQIQFAPPSIAITTTRLPWTWYSEKVGFDWYEFARRVDLFYAWNDDVNDFFEYSSTEFFESFFLSQFQQ